MLFQEQNRANNNWKFVETWLDPTASPPYILLLFGCPDGYHVVDPAEAYRIIFSGKSYEEARLWLLEDEYEQVRVRFFQESDEYVMPSHIAESDEKETLFAA